MADKNIRLKISETGAKKTSNSIGKVDGRLKSMAKSAVGVGIAYFGARGLISAFQGAIEAAGKQELAEKKLQTALGKTSKALLNQASALQQVTMFGDEDIIMMQSMLAAFTKNEDEIQKLTVATLDLASGMGIDLRSAGDLLAKTIGSSTNALSRYGISVEGAVGSNERLESLTGNIAKLFGGQAKAQTETLTGSLQQMSNAVGDAYETIGQLLSPVVIDVAKFLKSAAEGAGEFFQKMSETTLETSIRELQSLGVNTLELELAFAKAEAAKAKFAAINLKDEEQIEKSIEESRAKSVELIKTLANEQAKLMESGKSEDDLRKNVLRNRNKMVDLTSIEDQSTLRMLDNLKRAINEQEKIIKQNVEDLALVKQVEASKEQVAALENAITQSKKEQKQVEPTDPNETIPDIDAFDEFLIKQQKLVELKQQEKDFLDVIKEMYPELADAMGLVTDEEEKIKKLKDEKQKQIIAELKQAALVQGSAEDAMKAVVRAESMEAVAGLIASILKSVPFPFNTILAAGAGSTAAGLIDKGLSKFATGGDFITDGPQMIMVGDNATGRERVQVTPLGTPATGGGQGGISINFNAPVTNDDYVRDFIIPEIQKATRMNLA